MWLSADHSCPRRSETSSKLVHQTVLFFFVDLYDLATKSSKMSLHRNILKIVSNYKYIF